MKHRTVRFITFYRILAILLWFGLTGVVQVTAQTKAVVPAKIKVYLVGTFHFDSSPSDVIKGTKVDMSTPQNQRELDELVSKLKLTQADRVFVEWHIDKQRFVDSTYTLYRKNQFQLGNNEVYQVGYRLAKALNRRRIYCADADGDWNYDSAVVYAKQHGQEKLLKSIFSDTPTDSVGLLIDARIAAIKPTYAEPQKSTANTLLEQFINMNQASNDTSVMGGYLLHLARVGGGDNYVGADLSGDFFKRNVRIFTNMLREVDVQHDKAIILIIGNGHVPFLKSILRYNPLFEVMDVMPLLTAK